MKLSEGRVKAAKEIHKGLEECWSVSRITHKGVFFHENKERDIKYVVELLHDKLFSIIDLFEDLEYSLETGHKVMWSEAEEARQHE